MSRQLFFYLVNPAIRSFKLADKIPFIILHQLSLVIKPDHQNDFILHRVKIFLGDLLCFHYGSFTVKGNAS
ncbi:hypothetical protein C0674_12935 [Sporolactobacillus terrae]|uniref:Uncharacterized protein n=1 Tax=Sporolactobacillus terrae TaxID=269673 RepID=A0ABX5Q9T0_9BACL|nr:hypothetical protein C0674_12935 [Sporolactobacillus terrae]QAA26398.1 hypothetical protein C0679_12920 [Sporolactobacillus terrae]